MENSEIIESLFYELKKVIAVGMENEAKLILSGIVSRFSYITNEELKPKTNDAAIALFISSKEIEGCSSKSLKYYQNTLNTMLETVGKDYFLISTEDLRLYLSAYKTNNNVSKTTIDNVRRIISSFFTWLESENYIAKSPARRIHKVKTGKVVKEVYSEETVELIKQSTNNKRDLAIIDVLFSTGIRVGELTNLNKSDVNFENRECIVLGKGNKQRKVYFDAKTKLHLVQYLETRTDCNDALFVSVQSPFKRLQISGVEIMLRKIGLKLGIKKVHPHKFRRTLATKAIDKGMPIEQVQHMLGHSKIDTTLEYAMVDDSNVKLSHKKYLE